ncbi:hypothetical protein GGI20_006253, partial [Coemansia sp. BCRC 34301]
FFDPQDCRLVLPIAQADTGTERAGLGNSQDFARSVCDMLPLTSSVESQSVTAPHFVVADAEI